MTPAGARILVIGGGRVGLELAACDWPAGEWAVRAANLRGVVLRSTWVLSPRTWQDAVADIVEDLVASQPEALKIV